MAEIHILKGPSAGRVLTLEGEVISIGRAPGNTIEIHDLSVSGIHARLLRDGDGFLIEDLNSRNGTKVEDRTVMRKRLDPGNKLSIARHEYIIEYEPQELGAYGPPPADDDYMDELMRHSLMDRAGLKKRDQKHTSNRRNLEDEMG